MEILLFTMSSSTRRSQDVFMHQVLDDSIFLKATELPEPLPSRLRLQERHALKLVYRPTTLITFIFYAGPIPVQLVVILSRDSIARLPAVQQTVLYCVQILQTSYVGPLREFFT